MCYLLCFILCRRTSLFLFFFFNDTATTEIYTLSLHDALPISLSAAGLAMGTLKLGRSADGAPLGLLLCQDRKSTRLNSSHGYISYAVFCLKKKNKIHKGCRVGGYDYGLPIELNAYL